jgi:hypothetical protein
MAVRYDIRSALIITALAAAWAAAYSVGEHRYRGWEYSPFIIRFTVSSAPCAILLVMIRGRWWFVILVSIVAGLLGAAMFHTLR